jgi:7,8-dihydropterin-6-yl-methyl-4-(beta-D-ribofuranosyl)aminobenzene 5'-phosphate synthase
MTRVLLLWLCAAVLTAAQPRLTEILIVYDNTGAQPGLTADWGFAALVTRDSHRILLDTGAKAEVLLGNLTKLGVDPASLEHVVISHAHGDHTGGLEALKALNARLVVHWPDRRGGFQVVPGVYSTGVVEGAASEQALVIDTPSGLAILTGCSHPGVARMVEAADEQRGKHAVRLVLGGFHMVGQSADEIENTITVLRGLGVGLAVPTHCSGDLAVKLFRQAFGRGPGAGVGRRILLN